MDVVSPRNGAARGKGSLSHDKDLGVSSLSRYDAYIEINAELRARETLKPEGQ